VAFSGWNSYDPSDPVFEVVIGHAGGFTSEYHHLMPRYVVRAGQAVSKGQLIGYMGETGHATGVHLHWEVDLNGNPVNPRAYI